VNGYSDGANSRSLLKPHSCLKNQEKQHDERRKAGVAGCGLGDVIAKWPVAHFTATAFAAMLRGVCRCLLQ
jgi:hypothetical protein